jgi:hypothetical protein
MHENMQFDVEPPKEDDLHDKARRHSVFLVLPFMYMKYELFHFYLTVYVFNLTAYFGDAQ